MGPTIEFPKLFTEQDEYEMTFRGYVSDVLVTLPTGEKHIVNFFDPIRLQQELDSENQSGRPFFSEIGLIVLSDVTIKNIQCAVDYLYSMGFFEGHSP